MKYFNDLTDLSTDEVECLLSLANRLDEHPEPDALRGKVLALLFLSPSLRTLASFQAAMTRLGGGSFVISPEMSIHGIETRPGIVMDGVAAEHIREAIPVISSYADAVGIRAFAQRKSLPDDLADTEFKAMTRLVSKPYINMESAANHPCQSLADWKTLDDLGSGPKANKLVLSWCYHPRRLPLAVPTATIQMAAMKGMDVTILRPEGFELPEQVIAKAKQLASDSGASILETSDRREAMEDANFVYVKSWASTREYENPVVDTELRNELLNWCVSEEWFANASAACRLMHCLPVRRDVEVTEEVLDGPRSAVIPQARNRLLAQMAILHEMLTTGGR